MANWTAQEVAERDRIMRQQTARELTQALAPLAVPDPFIRYEDLHTVKHPLLLRPLKAAGHIRLPKGMNKTETLYAQHLALQQRAGAVLWYKYEGITLKIADDTRYTADFAVWASSGLIELHEVKGRGKRGARYEDDARVKMACAAEQFPIKIVMVWPAARTGEWNFREF